MAVKNLWKNSKLIARYEVNVELSTIYLHMDVTPNICEEDEAIELIQVVERTVFKYASYLIVDADISEIKFPFTNTPPETQHPGVSDIIDEEDL